VDYAEQYLRLNAHFNADRPNVFYMQGDTSEEGTWKSLAAGNDVDVVFLDASHDFERVWSDLNFAVQHLQPTFIVFDDYAAEEGVRDAVEAGIEKGLMKMIGALGETEGFTVKDGRTIEGAEGVICEVLFEESDESATDEHEYHAEAKAEL